MSDQLRSLLLSGLAGLSLLVLLGLAVFGIRAQRGKALADAQEALRAFAERVSTALDRRIDLELEEADSVRLYPPTPAPAESNPLQERFEEARASGDVEVLRLIRDDQSAGLSQSGLPLRALAAWAVFDLEPAAENAEILGRIALVEAPSLLSPKLLEQLEARRVENGLETPARLPDWREQWEASETTRRHLAQLGDSLPQSPGGNAVLRQDSLECVERLPDGAFKRIPAARLRQLIDATIAQSRHPPWMTVRTGDPQGPPLFPSRVDPSTPPLPAVYRGRLQVETRLTDRDQLFASIRRQTTWMIAVAGLAVTTAAAGLWLTQRALQRERQLNALKSQFVSSVSHELRAPVASMRLMAEALHSGKVTGERAGGEFHRLMAGEGARLSALIENVLDFARIEQGRKTYRKEPADLAALVDDSIKLMQPQAEARAVRLQFASDLNGFTPQVDAQAIQQALVNLLDNAIKHASKDTEVTVQLGRNGAGWFLSVQDQGPGIPASEHERIFQRFTRLGNELRRETQGTGIGLSLVKHIVEGHDGEVQVESAPGSGATFSMRFPAS